MSENLNTTTTSEMYISDDPLKAAELDKSRIDPIHPNSYMMPPRDPDEDSHLRAQWLQDQAKTATATTEAATQQATSTATPPATPEQ